MIDFKEKKIKITNNTVISKVDNHAILLNLNSGNYFELNEVALIIIQDLNNFKNLNEIISEVENNFNISKDECENDIVQFLNDLLERDLIEFEV